MIPDWNWGSSFLSKGRKKYERPLYDRGLRIWKENRWDPDSSINIGWNYGGNASKFVTYHKNGITTISGETQRTHFGSTWSPLRSHSVRLTIYRYAGVQIHQRNFKFYLQENSAPLTPPKIQGCRTCKQSGLMDSWCLPKTCYDSRYEDGVMVCETHPDIKDLGNVRWRSYHHMPCEHDRSDGHIVKQGQQCYYCKGTKKRDYGSKPFRTLWDGSPLQLRNGLIIKTTAATLLERIMTDHVESVS
jgi:hypothetical protein